MAVDGETQPAAFDYAAAIDYERIKFEKLVQIGIQAALPAKDGKFMPVYPVAAGEGIPNDSLRIIANTAYNDMPDAQKNIIGSMAYNLLDLLMETIDYEYPIDEKLYRAGREYMHIGYLQSSTGVSNVSERQCDITGLGRIMSQVGESGRKPDPRQGRMYEDVIDLGLMSLRQYHVFPYLYIMDVLRHEDENYIMTDPGIREGALRGMAAVQRVVKVTGDQTPLQSAILNLMPESVS